MDTELPLADELAAVYARLAGLLLSTETVHTSLGLITAIAKEVIPGTDGAGVTLRDEHGDRVTVAATSPLVTRADGLQYELDEGPCLTAWEKRTVVRVDDLTDDDRWPRWSRETYRATGMRAVLSGPLVAGDKGLGALNVYSSHPATYRDHGEHLLTMFAAHVAVLLANARSHEDARRVSDRLRDGMRDRDLVNLAKGVLMERESVDERAASQLLVGMARERGRPLREVADKVVGAAERRRR
jgi:GAF domain-containing protein